MTKLDNEEKNLLATFEAGEWQSVTEPARLQELQSYAKAGLAKPLEKIQTPTDLTMNKSIPDGLGL
jgi:hypothetical protein